MRDNDIREFVDSIKDQSVETDKTYSAIVSRIDGEGTVWVHLAGSEKETPTSSTSSEVKSGDEVTVEWRNNKLYIAGNYSNPSAGMVRVANVEAAANVAREAANNAVADANKARDAAESVQGIAEQARTAATQAQNSLKSVVQGATTVEKAVSVMQTALEAVVDYDPQNDTVQEYFWHDANGAHVLGDTSGYRNDIDSTGMNVVEVSSEKSVAEFGSDGARIGKAYEQGASDNESHMILDYHSMQMIDKEGNRYLHVSDLRDHDGNIVESIEVDSSFLNTFETLCQLISVIKVTVDNTELISGTDYTTQGNSIIFESSAGIDIGSIITVVYVTTSEEASLVKAFTFGTRQQYKIGVYSFSSGINNIASGYCSHAEGEDAKAFASQSHAEGSQTMADGTSSHAEGFLTVTYGNSSHSEGFNTVASKDCAHAEGWGSEARGYNSHAQNNHTRALSDNQTAIGKYNVDDNNDTYAVIVGNGTSNARSNALTVDWDGRIECGDYAGNLSSIFDIFYPVGSYYETSDTTFDPNVSWGGTWSLETEGLVHIGAGTNYAVGATGGHKTVKLTKEQSGLPSHGHGFTRPTVKTGGGGHSHTVTVHYRNAVPTNGSSAQPWAAGTLTSTGTATIASGTGTHSHTLEGGGVSDNTGADAAQSHDNMQPYIVVNRWHRTA